MYCRPFPLRAVRAELAAAGFAVARTAVKDFGRREDGSPRCRLILAREP